MADDLETLRLRALAKMKMENESNLGSAYQEPPAEPARKFEPDNPVGFVPGLKQGLAQSNASEIGALFDAGIAKIKGEPGSFSENYQNLKTQKKENYKSMKAYDPSGYGKGEMLGSALSSVPLSFIPGANTLKGALLTGAGVGGLNAFGESENKGANLLTDTLAGAGKGAAISGLVHGAVGGPGTSQALKDTSEGLAVRNLALPTAKTRAMREVGNLMGKAKEIGRMLIDKDVVNDISTAKTMYSKVASLMTQTGNVLRNKIYKTADRMVPGGLMNKEDLINRTLEYIGKDDPFFNSKMRSSVRSDLRDILERYGEKTTTSITKRELVEPMYGSKVGMSTKVIPGKHPKMNFTDVWEGIQNADDLSRQWGKKGAPSSYGTSPELLSKAANKMREIIGDEIKSRNPALADELLATSDLYRKLATAEDSLGEKALIKGKPSLPPTAYHGIVSHTVGSTPVVGAATGATDLMSRYYNKVPNFLQNSQIPISSAIRSQTSRDDIINLLQGNQ